MTDEIRYGVIGTGMMGIEHISNLNALEGAVVCAISDPHEASRTRGQQACADEVAVFEHHRDLVDSGLCDAVVVASPNMTHAEVLADLLPTELHILVEKPLCTTVEDCRHVVARAAKRDALVWVGLEYRYMPPVARLIDEVQRGTVGKVHMVAIREHRYPFLPKVGDWNRFSRNTGGTLVEKCCHFFDLMNLLIADAPTRVFASGGQSVNHLEESYAGETPDILDNAFVIVEYAGGARAMLDLCMFAEATHNQEEISVLGELGKVEALIPEDDFRIGRRGEHFIGRVEHQRVKNEIPYQGLHHGSSYVEHARFLASIREGAELEVPPSHGLRSVALGIAAHRSIDENRAVLLSEISEPSDWDD
jgi:predicted dehydrogenase